MIKTISAIVTAAIVAAAFVAFPNLTQPEQARAAVFATKGDRADTRPLALACSQNAWPYFESSCLRDTRNTFSEARSVRIVTADRLPQR